MSHHVLTHEICTHTIWYGCAACHRHVCASLFIFLCIWNIIKENSITHFCVQFAAARTHKNVLNARIGRNSDDVSSFSSSFQFVSFLGNSLFVENLKTRSNM